MTYRLEVQPPAQRDFDDLPRQVQEQVAEHLRGLTSDPRPPGIMPVECAPRGCYRIRVGRYRIGYRVDDKAGLVSVWAIGLRGTFYKVAERRAK